MALPKADVVAAGFCANAPNPPLPGFEVWPKALVLLALPPKADGAPKAPLVVVVEVVEGEAEEEEKAPKPPVVPLVGAPKADFRGVVELPNALV